MSDHLIEQPDDDLFAGLEAPAARPSTYVDKADKQAPSTHGGCPSCTKDKVGLILQNGHLAWTDHYVATWGGAARQCAAGGQRLCELPARDVRFLTGLDTPICTCTNQR
jgi:hypothetical protein